jgi:hypothetical protein
VTTTLQLQLNSLNEAEAAEIEAVLNAAGDLTVQRWRQVRVIDPVTIISVSGGIVGLVNGLLQLRDRWASREKPSGITVENEAGDQIDISRTTRDELETMVRAE